MRKFTRNIYILGVIFAFVAGLNAYVGLMHVNAPIRREQERQVQAGLDYVMGEIESTFVLAEQTLRVAGHYIGMEPDEDKVTQFLEELARQNASHLAMYLGTPNQDTSAPWYTAAVKEGEVAYTASSDYPRVITVWRPVLSSEQELLAVVAVDLSIGDLLASLETGEIWEEMSLFFLADGVRFLGDSVHGFPDLAVFREPQGLMPLQLEGKQGFLRWETVGESGLIALTFVAPGDLALEGEQNRIVIAVVIVSLVVGSALVFLFLRIHIVRPMRELGDDLLAISLDGNVGYRLPPGRNQSLGVFRRTLNVTLHKAQEHHEQIIRQQAELSQAYKQLKDHEQILHGQYVQLKENKEKIRFLAEYDGLTGLPNRRRFQDDLQEALDKGESGVVILIDLDDFKNINDTQGHSFGDDVLCSVAQGLQEELTPGATAYRFGGDEFALIVQHQTSPADLKMSADCTLERLHAITSKEGKKFSVTSSMGVVSYPVDGRTVDELLIKVDIALHHVKTAGKNHYVFFEESMVEVFNERVQMEEILAEAVRTNGFYLVYQPIVATRTGTIVSFEALVRLKNHAVLPSVFMPIAEESDLTISLGYWVIKEVMGQLATWRAEGKTPKAVSVNLSLKQFHDPNLIGFLTEQLRESGIDSSLFEVEFPEEVLLGHAEKALQTMEGLKRLGISQSLDDYGSGYSFIDYMTKMPVDYLKVHGSFTENIQTNPHVMEGLISIAHGLGMEIVAEQVETLDQARGLSQISCDYLQGHLLCPPVVSQEAELLFELDYAQILNFDR